MASNKVDLEKGFAFATTRSNDPSWPSSAAANTTVNVEKLGALTPLQLFQVLVGIHTPPSLLCEEIDSTKLASVKSPRHPKGNVGLYQRAIDLERSNRRAFVATKYISSTLYMLQIFLATTFTALSAFKDTSAIVLTILGAVNTVVAGCLAWQKGQGVPQRYHKAQDEYQALIIDVEMTERSFMALESSNGRDGLKLDPRAEMARLQKLFDTARADQQANYPDLYVSTGQAAAKETKGLTKELEDQKAEADKIQGEMMNEMKALMAQLASKAEEKVHTEAEDVIEKVVKY